MCLLCIYLAIWLVITHPSCGCAVFPASMPVCLGPDTIRRWANEVIEALNNKAKIVQHHAFTLLLKIRQHDRLAIGKAVSQLTKRTNASYVTRSCWRHAITFTLFSVSSGCTASLLNADASHLLALCTDRS